MQFLSACFILPFLGLLWLLPHMPGTRGRQALLLLFSLYFIGLATGPQNLAVMFAFVLAGYLLQRFVVARTGRLATGLLALIGVFFLLQQLTWSAFGVGALGNAGMFGVAFMLARIIHVLVDQAQARAEDRVDALGYFTFCLSFLTFLSGPLQRQEAHQANIRDWAPADTHESLGGLLRFLKGVLILTLVCPLMFQAAEMLLLQAAGWQQSAAGGGATALHPLPLLGAGVVLGWAAALMPLYLYANFSAYMDMVIGMGRMLGLSLPENFNRPFVAVTLQEFFQRWHMTMSRWFQDYVFTPTVKKLILRWPRTEIVGYLGLVGQVVTFFAVAFWHAVDLLFLKIGLLLALFVVADRGRDLFLNRILGHARFRELSARADYRMLIHAVSYGAITIFVAVYVTGSGNLPAVPISLDGGIVAMAVIVAMTSAAIVRLLLRSRPARALRATGLQPVSPMAKTLLIAVAIALLLLHALQEGGDQYPGFIYARF